VRPLVAVLALCLALPAPAQVYVAPKDPPGVSDALKWQGPTRAVDGRWRSTDAEILLAQSISNCTLQREQAWNDLGDCKAKCALDSAKAAAAVNHTGWWVAGGVLVGVAAGYLAARAVK
jgi:hypothetical protein